MLQTPKKDSLISALLTLGIFYFAFMFLDRTLSLIYGFNFQPYGPWAPPGFTYWGHAANGSLAALGTYLIFRLYSYGERENRPYLRILALAIFAVVGAVIPYMNDSEHLIKNGAEATLLVYIVANDLYVFTWGLLTHRILKSNRDKSILLLIRGISFLFIHIFLYEPRFPEFYWS
jgi:hypothetical protein